MKNAKNEEISQVTRAALIYTKSGLSILPTGKDKVPKVNAWKARQQQIPPEDSIKVEFAEPYVCVAIVAGKVSGNLEMIDFDFEGKFFD